MRTRVGTTGFAARAALAVSALVGTLLAAPPAFATAPTITSFSPTSGVLNQYITITGTGFVAPTTVQFGSVSTTSTVVSSTTLSVRVPLTAGTAPITVSNANGTATSSTSFVVNPGIVLNATQAAPTATIKVYASGLAPNEGADIYFDTTDTALIGTSSTGALSASLTIPASASPGTHWISVQGRHSGSFVQTALVVRTNWLQSGGNAAHTNFDSLENTLNASNATNLDVVWTWNDAGSPTLTSQPAIANGTVYVADSTGGSGYVNAISESTGALPWYGVMTGAPKGTPVVVGSTVYAGTDAGYVYGFPTTGTGTVHAATWTDNLGGDLSGSLVYSGGLLYAADAAGNKVYALNPANGAVTWTSTLTVGTSQVTSLLPPVVHGNQLEVAGIDQVPNGAGGTLPQGFTAALYSQSGAPLWTSGIDNAGATYVPWGIGGYSPPSTSPYVYANGRDFGGGSSAPAAGAVADGSVLWFYYGASQGSKGYTPCDPSTSTVYTNSAPAYGYGLVYFTTEEGRTCAVRPSDGKLMWTSEVGNNTSGTNAPAVANGLIFTWDEPAHTLHALSASTGQSVWSHLFPATTVMTTPVVVDGSVFVTEGSNLVKLTIQSPTPTSGASPRPSATTVHPNYALVQKG